MYSSSDSVLCNQRRNSKMHGRQTLAQGLGMYLPKHHQTIVWQSFDTSPHGSKYVCKRGIHICDYYRIHCLIIISASYEKPTWKTLSIYNPHREYSPSIAYMESALHLQPTSEILLKLPTFFFNDTKILHLCLQSRGLKIVECIQSNANATTAATYAKSILEVLEGSLGLAATRTAKV
jgi:hypothetical protein